MASKKKEELLQPEVQTQAQPAAQSTYSAEGLNSRADVEKAMANVSYRPGQQVTDAADALKQWQQNRPADYQSSYQDKINSLLGQLLERENFQYSYTRDPLYRQYEQLYTQNAHNASADAAAQAAALTGGYGSSYATSAAQQDRRAGQRHPHPVQSGAGYLPERRRRTGEPAGPAERTGAERPDPV